MEKKTFYVTTPLYYPNAKPHVGHAYTTVAADTLARYKKMRGYDVKFLTGTDEHGQKIERVALEKGVTPKEYVDEVVAQFKSLWKVLDIDFDIFIRTTDDYHEKAVQKIFKTLYDKGDIYKSRYEGNYCTPCETFYTERQLVEGKCPDCGGAVEIVTEETYFFRLSKYQDRLMKHFEENPDFIRPRSRMNEMINNFLKPGLEDLSVSRTTFKWGVPVSFDTNHVVYVWIDALSNYINALGYLSEDDSNFRKYWPADVHMMAKEIVRFHSIIWPALLMALDLPLPKQIYGHGFYIMDGGKMSKSKGNVIDPVILTEKYGVDSLRYFLLREMVLGQDANFSNEALITRMNSDLANDLGNLLSRTVGMINSYFGGKLPGEQKSNAFDETIISLSKEVIGKTEEYMDGLIFNEALNEIWVLVRRCNKYIDETTPWVLAKDPSKKEELAGIMYTLCESLRIIGALISPFMPNTPPHIYSQLNIKDDNLKNWESIKNFGSLPREVQVTKGAVVFPRIDVKKELEELEKLLEPTKTTEENPAPPAAAPIEEKEIITIDDFVKLDLRVGEVLECEKIKGSDKLLKSQIKVGERVHQVVSGIAQSYTPEEMVGKKVILVANLKPVKLRGHISEGMILAATGADGKIKIATVEGNLDSGAVVK